MMEQLTNHLWQSTVCAIAIALLTIFFRKSGAHVRYWLWFSASIKFFVPFAVLLAFGQQLEWASTVRHVTSPVVSDAVSRMSEPFLEIAPSNLPALPSDAHRIDWTGRVVPGVWACGFLAIALIRIRLWWRIRKVVNGSTRLELPEAGIASSMQIRSAPGLLEPGVVGLWRPTLLVPAGLENHLAPSQLKAVIAHEVTHVRRRDNLTAAVHMLVEALFWFHPFVWWIGARLLAERERACDEAVLRLLGEPEAYAEGILAVCKRYIEAPVSCVSGVSGSDIKKRIEAIMSNRIGMKLTLGRKTVLVLSALFAFSVPIVVGSMTAVPPPPFPWEPGRVLGTVLPSAPSAEVTKLQVDKPAAPRPELAPVTVKEFEEASIRQCDSNNLPTAPQGARGGGADSFQMTPGRLHALCMTLATLIRTAYGYEPAGAEFMQEFGGRGMALNFNSVYGLGTEDGLRVKGGPDWVRNERYTIEAVAEGPADAATIQGPMLRALLERRFQLRTHIDSEQVPAFALSVDKRGLKIKPAQPGTCEPLPEPKPGVPVMDQRRSFENARRGEKPSCGLAVVRNGPNVVMVGGGQTIDGLITFLGASVGRIRVLDKTGITDKFNFILEFANDENTPGASMLFRRQDVEPSDIPRGPSIYSALEDQLGLRLEPTRAPRAFVVIDHVERLSPN
jgi:bla regulator protein BlaR1